MKHLSILLLALLGAINFAQSQNPEKIYIGTWTSMYDLGTAVTPNPDDPQLDYNEATGCYEGEIIDWARTNGISAWNAKIPYSVSDGVITYYSNTTSTNIYFSDDSLSVYDFISSTNPASMKGFVISQAFPESVVDVKISINLTTSEISFTKFDSGQGTILPELVSVEPENGSTLIPAEDGSVEISILFSGPITSMEALSEGTNLKSTPNDDKTVWTIMVPENVIRVSTNESQGRLTLTVLNVYADGLPLAFNGGSAALNLYYLISGITNEVFINFSGDREGLEDLKVYKYPDTEPGNEIEIDNNSLDVTFKNSVTYLFTAGEGYEINVSSSVESDNDNNWKITKNNPANVSLSIYEGSNGAVFSIEIVKEDAGIAEIESQKIWKVFTIQGIHLISTTEKSVLKALPAGLYIINGKKVIL